VDNKIQTKFIFQRNLHANLNNCPNVSQVPGNLRRKILVIAARNTRTLLFQPVAYPGLFFGGGGGGLTNSVVERERGYGGGSPLVRGSGGSCNLVQEISFHIVNFS
jgi:hypothetical protein